MVREEPPGLAGLWARLNIDRHRKYMMPLNDVASSTSFSESPA